MIVCCRRDFKGRSRAPGAEPRVAQERVKSAGQYRASYSIISVASVVRTFMDAPYQEPARG